MMITRTHRALPFFGALLALCAGCGPRSGTSLASNQKSGEGTTAASGDPAFLPDPSRTPGDTLDVTKEDICRPGYSSVVRNVSTEVKQQVYADYGIDHHKPGEYEVDHLISLELGGSNRPKNLWPQPYTTHPWNAHVKDALENALHRQVCSGEIDLKTAQQWIAQDWIAAYRRVFHSDTPTSAGSATHTGQRGRADAAESAGAATNRRGDEGESASASGADAPAGKVWVNTSSGKFFQPGTRYYGHTKQGKFMSQDQAVQQGYRQAKGQ